jgi:hypothetical protein
MPPPEKMTGSGKDKTAVADILGARQAGCQALHFGLVLYINLTVLL